MRRRIAIAVTAIVFILVLLTSTSQYEPRNRMHCIVDELAAAGFFDQ
jgi:low affinity Fe/Cu permease